MEMKTFKIRCSALSEIMGGSVGITEVQSARIDELSRRKADPLQKPLTKNMEEELADLLFKKENPKLPTGAQTYCKKWIKYQMFKRKEEWKSLVIDKGLACEEDGIKLLGEVRGLDGISKNDEFFENEFMQGNPDIIHNNKVRDTKLSWDLYSFPMFEKEHPDKDYWWQLQGYMILTGLKEASLDYVLIDTPMPIVLLDLKKLYYQSGGVAEEWSQEKYEFLYPNYRFDDVPKEMRVKSFEFELDTTLENKIKERVLLCRKYIAEVLTEAKVTE